MTNLKQSIWETFDIYGAIQGGQGKYGWQYRSMIFFKQTSPMSLSLKAHLHYGKNCTKLESLLKQCLANLNNLFLFHI
jgi:hypothetical protein